MVARWLDSRTGSGCRSSTTHERIHAAHAGPMRRIQRLVERGQREGVFRDDLPVSWLVALYHSVVHGAADAITAGRLSAADAAYLITATLDAAYTPPGVPVPRTR